MAFTQKTTKVWDEKFTKEIKMTATGSGAIAETLTPVLSGVAEDFKLVQVELTFDADPTTAEDFEVTLDSVNGAVHDARLHQVDPTLQKDPSNIILVSNVKSAGFVSGDTIDFAYNNTDANTWGLIVTYRVRY